MKIKQASKVLRAKGVARLIGPVVVVLTLSEIWNAGIWSENTVVNIYQNGTLLFIAGVAMVSNHNDWSFRWTIVITLIGWFAILLGMYRIFFPQHQLLLIKGGYGLIYIIPVYILLFCAGSCLTMIGYRRSN